MNSKAAKIGIIGGSGVEELLFTGGFHGKTVKTRYGDVVVREGEVEGKQVIKLI